MNNSRGMTDAELLEWYHAQLIDTLIYFGHFTRSEAEARISVALQLSERVPAFASEKAGSTHG